MLDSLPALKTKPKQFLKRLFRSGFSRRLIVSLLAFLIIVPTVLLLFRPPQASAVWFDDNYGYRQKFSFTHNADITSERRITVTIDTASLITAGVMQSNCADTRFTDINGKLLRYTLTGTCNNSATTYDVVFPSIINGTNVGYVYYGNPIAASRSDTDVSQVTALTPSGGAPSITGRANEEKGQTPVLSWKFDEGYGTTAYDGSQYQNNGTLTSGPTWQNEDMCLFGGKCLQFDGSNDNVQKTYSSDTELNVGTASMSASLWYKHPSSISATQYLISRYTTSATAGGYKLYMKSTGVVCFGIDDDSTWNPDDEVCDSNSTADSKWHHMEAVKSEGSQSITLYVDGKQVNQKTSLSATGSLSGNSPTFYVGIDADGTSSPWNGFIDQVKIYNFARSSDQAKTDFTNKGSVDTVSTSIGSPDPYASLNQGLVGYWKMDDGVGNACPSGVDKACDSSGNGNVGTWTNGAASTSGKFGFATNYDGVNDSVNLGIVPAFNFSNANSTFTLSAWVKPRVIDSYDAIISHFEAGFDERSWSLHLLDGRVGVTLCVVGTFPCEVHFSANGNAVATGTWSHVAVTVDIGTDTFKLYKDGQEVPGTHDGTMTTITSIFNDDNVAVHIGCIQNNLTCWSGVDEFDGSLDDVRIYNRALSPSEIFRLYDWSPAPVGWWKMDERTGTQAFDSSGNANTGTLTGGPQWSSGKLSQALSFDGVDDYVDMGNISTYDFPDTTFTVTGWFKSTTGGTPHIVGKNASSANSGWFIQFESDHTISANIKDASGAYIISRTSAAAKNDGAWHHFAGIITTSTSSNPANDVTLYVDGVKDSGAPFSASSNPYTAPTTGSLRIGARGDGTVPFNGQEDDVRLYNYALTPKQIVSVMNAGHPAVGSPVGSAMAHYKFDEGYGTTANNSGANGSSLNGTLSGTTLPSWRNEGKFGKALNFSGSTAYVDMGNPTAAQITSDLTLSSWVYLSSNTANQDIIAKRGLSSQWGYRLWVDSTGTPKIDVSSTGNVMATASASQTLNKNQWYHLLGTYSASQSAITIYIDGVQKGQTTSSVPNSLQNSTANLNIGREAGAVTPNYVNGTLDEMKIYNYALSADEVKVEYNQGKAVVLGSLSTDPDGTTASNSAARAYCPPGDTATCNPPIGHWTFDERTGTTANDITGNANTGTLTNGPQWVTGKIGQGLGFDGVNQYGDVNQSSTLKPTAGVTTEGWFMRTGSFVNYSAVFSSPHTASDCGGYLLTGLASGKMRMYIDSNGSCVWSSTDSTTLPSANTWYHVVGTWDGSNIRIYVNGVLENTTSATTIGYGTITKNAQIGGYQDNAGDPQNSFPGLLDDIRVYNYARTPAQVAWDYNRGGPVGWWKFDECTGTTVYDASGQGNNGTINTPSSGTQTKAGNCVTTDTAAAWYNGKDGKYNSSLGFDGTDDYGEVTDTANLHFDESSKDFSLFAWTKRTTTGTEYILSKEDADNDGWRMQFNSSNQVLCSEDATDVTSTSTITDTNWHLIGCTIDRDGNGQIYIDAVANGSTVSMGTDAMATTSNIRIGTRSYTSTSYFNGLIDDVRLYPYVLTPTQIRTVYNENSAVRFGPLTGSP